ncbi:MAG TPA: TPM domain-containing protein [Pyrinomonadaceae bacterium]|nr:TPM domain-containing protein [Pyrinomonadaceae bacterium]
MKLPLYRKTALLFVGCSAVALLLVFAVTQRAQTDVQMPSRMGHINDFAHAIDDATRQQLENTLENLKQKTGIQFDVATVETTGGQDIFDFSQQLAQSWNVVGRSSTGKSLLLVLSVNDKTSFTHFSKEAQRELPEGVLGEISQRLRGYLNSGRAAAGVTDAVDYFVGSVARSRGFNVEDLNAPVAAATVSPAANEPTPDTAASPQVSPEAVAVVTSRDIPAAQPIVKPAASRANDESEAEEVELTLTLPVSARVAALRKFIDAHPDSSAKPRALELLVSSHAAFGDELLKKGDSAGGIEQLLLAISEAPPAPSDKLFAGVISQIPLNLYLRRERAAADTAARNIIAKFGADPKKLLAVAAFYVAIERGAEAWQIATQATKLAPDLAEAHQMLGLALHVSFRLDEAAAEYKRALELDPKSKTARRGLADLRRAFGKDEEALALYREQLAADPADKGARAGIVISLLDLGRTDEAKTELEAGLQADPKNLPLLSSAAYWFAAHKESDLALGLGNRAVEIEPRYTWSHVAVARALIAQRNPLAAEGVIRFARQYGKFPTLDYELANALASAGLYDEAAEVLTQTFRFNNDKIETQLGGRVTAQAANFIELLAPERQASLFQLTAADSEGSTKVLKDLLVLATALNSAAETINEPAAVAAAKEFASGTDASLGHRKLYAASKLLQKGIGFQTAYELAEAARTSADAALTVPAVTLAVQADEYREIRARAIASGGTSEIIEAPPNILSNILRGHIEDTSGWALFNLDKPDEAVDHLSRAVNIFPAGTPGLRVSLWHLGAALERQGKNEEAISAYIKSYNAGVPDPLRRAIIEKLYRRVNGSLEGLDGRIGETSTVAVSETAPARNETNATTPAAAPEKATNNAQPTISEPAPAPSASPEVITPAPSPEVATSSPSPTPSTEVITATPTPSPTPSPRVMTTTPTPSPEVITATPTPSPTPSPGVMTTTPTPSPEVITSTPTPSPTPSTEVITATPSPSPQVKEESQPSPTPTPEPAAAPTPTPVPETTPTTTPSPETKPVETPATTPVTFTVSGLVKDASNNALVNVVVVLISSQGTVLTTTTDELGNYSFTVAPSDRGYRIIPSRDGFTFEPVDKLLPSVSGDVRELNFIGTPAPKP